MSARDPLSEALDRFDAPAMSLGLADRIMAATAPAGARAALRRDRRGLWRRGRQVVIGTVAFGMLSAAAVASGLLGRVGIEVPVLTAMLDPKPAPTPKKKPVVAPKPVRQAKAAPPVMPTVAPEPMVVQPRTFAERAQIHAERRERIATFVERHPRAAAVIAQRVGQQLRQRETVRREVLGMPPANPLAPGFRPLTPEERFVLRQERRRDLRRAGAMIERRIAARQARLDQRASDMQPTETPPPAVPSASVAPAE